MYFSRQNGTSKVGYGRIERSCPRRLCLAATVPLKEDDMYQSNGEVRPSNHELDKERRKHDNP